MFAGPLNIAAHVIGCDNAIVINSKDVLQAHQPFDQAVSALAEDGPQEVDDVTQPFGTRAEGM